HMINFSLKTLISVPFSHLYLSSVEMKYGSLPPTTTPISVNHTISSVVGQRRTLHSSHLDTANCCMHEAE
ncbi:hypothetical protein HispidOSU_018998, partial [Sigmodon hispidus]